jgi:hypothetical protein
VNAGLYERLLMSNDPESVLSVARSEKQPIDAKEIIKDPMVLEFLGLKPESTYYEKDLVIIEIKTSKITHQDIGQLQMYVNYHDRYEKKDHENPTIGILLCADKNDTLVKITLPENNQTLVASKYQLYLPTEQQLLEVVRGIEKG